MSKRRQDTDGKMKIQISETYHMSTSSSELGSGIVGVGVNIVHELKVCASIVETHRVISIIIFIVVHVVQSLKNGALMLRHKRLVIQDNCSVLGSNNKSTDFSD